MPDTARLIDALTMLSAHGEEIERYYCSTVRLQVRDAVCPQTKLQDIFCASVNERRGASFERGKVAVTAFAKEVPTILARMDQCEDIAGNHQWVFEKLCMLPNIDQKIAAMYLKFVVNVFGMWERLRPHLYVPLDRVVLKLLKEKLQFSDDLPDQSPSVKDVQKRLRKNDGEPVAPYRRFLRIQELLAEAAQEAKAPRILVDELWLIGQLFCREYPLCHACWISEACAARSH